MAELVEHRATRFDQVPFVERDDQCTALFDHERRDTEILSRRRHACVKHHDDDLGQAKHAERVGDRELLERCLHARLAPKARRIDQPDRAAAIAPIDRDGIACQPGLRPCHHPLLADELIEQRGLADIGPPDDREAQRPLAHGAINGVSLGVIRRLGVGMGRYHVIEIDEPFAMSGGDGNGLAETQLKGFETTGFTRTAFAFVGDDVNRLAGAPEVLRERAIIRRNAGASVNDE